MSSPFSLFLKTPTSTQPQPQPQQHNSTPNKKNKPRPKKKTPQRGMGVERLERLRLQELQKTTSQQQHVDLYNHPFNLNLQPLPEPVQCYPVHYGLPVNMYGSGNCGGGFLGWDQNNVQGFNRVENGGFGLNGRVVGSGQVLVGNYAYGVDDHIRNSSNVKELSSLPNVFVSNMQQHHSSYCDLCLKKKMLMINGDQSLGHSRRRRSNFSPQISPTNTPDFLGLNSDNNINFNRNKPTGSFNTSRPARNSSHANHIPTKGKDVVGVHRNGNKSGEGKSVLMEYEFFPRSKTSEINYGTMTSTASKELGSSEASVAVGSGVGGGEASSCVTMCDYSSVRTSNSIDLSLRLSC